MSPVVQFWLLIIVLAVGTWSMRSWPIILHGRVPHPPWLERVLRHVPVAALTALVVPGALYLHERSTYSFAPARTIAAVIALVVAWRTKNTLATLAVGMAALWVAQWALGALG
ncbi:MAG: AzlD domain-containing protein [Actinobacteria bacterium HGW-Actinobacteria-7]|nr:MAG: AzlD domain-containing protein [Actinobacteria bacterium HGW-Actinobacteria-7]